MNGLSEGAREGRLAAKFTAVSLVGFATDGLLLQLGIWAGLEPAWARLISLAVAMQVTFLINAKLVFRSRQDSKRPWQWARYMVSNGVGNCFNYWIFVTLVSTHWAYVSDRFFALSVGAIVAWAMNFASARLVVFGRERQSRHLPDVLADDDTAAP